MAEPKKKTPNQASIDRAKVFMVKAILKNDLKTLERIMGAGYPVEEPIGAYGGQSPLMYAVSASQPEIVKALLENYGASVKTKDTAGRTALHHCCRGGNIQNFKVLVDWIKSQEDLQISLVSEESTNGGVTPLMCAISSANIYMVGQCLNSSFNPFSRDFSGRSCTDYAEPFRDVNGENIKNLILTAQEQWRQQVPAEQIAQRLGLSLDQVPQVFQPFYEQVMPATVTAEASEMIVTGPPAQQVPVSEQPTAPVDEAKMDDE